MLDIIYILLVILGVYSLIKDEMKRKDENMNKQILLIVIGGVVLILVRTIVYWVLFLGIIYFIYKKFIKVKNN